MAVSGKRHSPLELYCQPCNRDGPRIEAFGYCQDCSEYLCETCYNVHNKPTPSRHHRLLDWSKMPKQSQSASVVGGLTEEEHCQKHDNKIIEYHCKTHDALCCNVCVTLDHRSCKVDYIPEVSRHFNTGDEYRKILESMRSLHCNVDKVKQKSVNHLQEIEKNREKVKNEIKQYRKDIDKILDTWEEQMNKKADEVFDDVLVKAKSIEMQCEKMLKDICDLENVFENVKKNNVLLYIKEKKHNKDILQIATEMNEMDTDTYYPNLFHFQPDSKVQTFFQSQIMFGNISQRKRPQEILQICQRIKLVEKTLKQRSEPGFANLFFSLILPPFREIPLLKLILSQLQEELQKLEREEAQERTSEA